MMDKLFLAFHVFGVILWVGGLLAVALFLAAARAQPDVGARARVAAFARKAAMIPDIGATLAIVFGLHWLFRFKLYTLPYMHIKLTLVVFLIALHGFLRVKTKRMAQGGETSLPPAVPWLLGALALGIVIVVMLKVPS